MFISIANLTQFYGGDFKLPLQNYRNLSSVIPHQTGENWYFFKYVHHNSNLLLDELILNHITHFYYQMFLIKIENWLGG